MEFFDICDENGNPTGETVERSVAHRDGICHRTAHVWIARKNKSNWDLLLQKRSMQKDSFPGCYDTSSAGHIPAGQEVKESALRELEEELGIVAVKEQLHFTGVFRVHYESTFHGKIFRDNEIANVFVYLDPIQEDDLKIQKEELDGVLWMELDAIRNACEHRDGTFCVPTGGLNLVSAYLKKLEDT